MFTPKLILSTLLLLGLSSLSLAAYAVAPDLAPSISHGLQTQFSGATVRADSGALSLPGSAHANAATLAVPGQAGAQLDAGEAMTATETLTGSLKIATAIADHFNVPIADITQLHDSGWGYGEIFKLYSLAQASGKTVTEIEAMRNAGMGWGEIAAALNLPPGNHGNNLGSIVSPSHGNPSAGPGDGKSKSPPGKGAGPGKGKGQGKGK